MAVERVEQKGCSCSVPGRVTMCSRSLVWALGLKKAGYIVQFGVPTCSVKLATSLGVDAVGTQGDVEELLDRPEMKVLSARTDVVGMAKF